MGRSWASLALSVRHGPTIVAQPQPVFARLDGVDNVDVDGNVCVVNSMLVKIVTHYLYPQAW